MIYIQLSTWAVTAKPPKSDTKWYKQNAAAAAFSPAAITDEAFAEALQQGHAFRAAGSKSDTATTNVIAYDFDTTDTRLIDRLETLIDHPLVWYSSYSDSPEKPRYRLIFKLSRPISSTEYPAVYEGIARRNRFWAEIDRRPYCQFYFSGRNIRYNQAPTEINPDRYLIQQQPLTATTTTETAADPQPNRPAAKPSYKPRKAAAKPTTADPDLEAFIRSFGHLTPAAAASKGGAHEERESGLLLYNRHTPLPDATPDDEVIYFPDGYLAVPERRVWDSEQRIKRLDPFRDGEGRYRIIYLTGQILKAINPKLTAIEHAKAVLLEVLLTTDFSDGKYTAERIIRIAYKAYNDTTKDTFNTKQHQAKYKVNDSYCDTHHETKRQVCGRTNAKSRKAANYEVFATIYDETKTDLQNLIQMAKNGISRRNYYRYKDEYQNNTKTT